MKKAQKLLSILAIVLLMSIGLETAYATSAIQDSSVTLPDFLLRWAEKISNGNASELARRTNQIIQQEKINKDRIASTNGAVLNLSMKGVSSVNSLSYYPPYYATITNIYYNSPDTIDIVTQEVVGHIDNPDALENTADNNFAWLKTTGWNENNNWPEGGEAFGVGSMTGYWACGDVYITAKTDQPSWDNYVIVSIYVTGYEAWYYLGWERVTSTSPSDVYIGTTYASFSDVAIECWTPPPYPQYYEPLMMNSVYVDSLISVMYW
jgi:hypothetical protein